MDSKTSTCTDNEVWDKSLFVGLNAKQKKNLRKKLQRQRKQAQKSTVDLNESIKNEEDDSSLVKDKEIDDIDIDVNKEGKDSQDEDQKQNTAEKKP